MDVIFHLVEDETYENYMNKLFDSSNKSVIIYSSNQNGRFIEGSQVRHRLFTDWIKGNKPEFHLISKIMNEYPITNRMEPESFCDFYIFEK